MSLPTALITDLPTPIGTIVRYLVGGIRKLQKRSQPNAVPGRNNLRPVCDLISGSGCTPLNVIRFPGILKTGIAGMLLYGSDIILHKLLKKQNPSV